MKRSAAFRHSIPVGSLAMTLLPLAGNAPPILMAAQASLAPAPEPPALPPLPSFPVIYPLVMGAPAVEQAWQTLVQLRQEGEAAGVVWEEANQATEAASVLVNTAILAQTALFEAMVAALEALRLEWLAQGYAPADVAAHAIQMGQLLTVFMANGIQLLFSPAGAA